MIKCTKMRVTLVSPGEIWIIFLMGDPPFFQGYPGHFTCCTSQKLTNLRIHFQLCQMFYKFSAHIFLMCTYCKPTITCHRSGSRCCWQRKTWARHSWGRWWGWRCRRRWSHCWWMWPAVDVGRRWSQWCCCRCSCLWCCSPPASAAAMQAYQSWRVL